MKKAKFYAVFRGRKPGIYRSWPECKRQIHRFPNAIFKSFFLHADAARFIATGGVERTRHFPKGAKMSSKPRPTVGVPEKTLLPIPDGVCPF